AGNNAICITAKVISEVVGADDLVIRYGGDEFQIVTKNVEAQYWENMKETINKRIAKIVMKQKLPYELGVSLGYAICDMEHPMTIEECCERADKAMYENKKLRKSKRKYN
ncbi:MAG: GGDEF domain-containing protein, partial [Lachnospiraceae bacterium]|nr:GGDEF domain-containing protein [Lachnospiraceae bacterium]